MFVTWPTSYEGLVGRAELKEGTCSAQQDREDLNAHSILTSLI